MGEIKQIDQQLEWITAIKTNNEHVLKKLYTDNFRKIEKFILMNNGSHPQAKDTYQEAFITVWRNVKAGKFEPRNETALQGYLFQIAKNKWTDFLRSSRFKKTQAMPDQMEASAEWEPEETEKNDNQLLQVMGAFKKLGVPCRELLTYFYFGKKSVREIAGVLNIEEASARNKKYRCMQKLKELTLTPN